MLSINQKTITKKAERVFQGHLVTLHEKFPTKKKHLNALLCFSLKLCFWSPKTQLLENVLTVEMMQRV